MKTLVSRFRPEQIRTLFLIGLIILVFGFFSSQIPGYMSTTFINRLSTSVAVIATLAVAQTLVFLTRNFDLSLGSICGVTAYIVGQQLGIYPNLPPVIVVLLALGLGVVMGTINGVIIAYGRVPSLITTIGTLALYRSFLVWYSKSVPITTDHLPQWMADLAQVNLATIYGLEVRLLFVMMLAVVLIFQLVLSFLPFGRRLYAIGSNPDAARVAGFPAQRIVFLAFILSGALGGLAGFIFLARFGNITVLAATGYEFQAIAAAVVGGVSNMGGSGTVFGAFLGAVLIDLLNNSLLRWPVISQFWIDAILGMLILAAVALDYVVFGRLKSLWARSELQMRSGGEEVREKAEVPSHVG